MPSQLSFGAGDASFQAAGGEPGIRKLVDDFYEIMSERPAAQVIRAMHPADLEVSRDKLTRFLCGWLGGPRLFQERYGRISIPQVHAHFPIGEAERDAWLECMKAAADRQPYSEAFVEYLLRQLRVPAQRIVETSAGAVRQPS